MARRDETRLMVKVAKLYHEERLRQPEIAQRLRISQAKVSRLLKQAMEDGVVRVTVHAPSGVDIALERALETSFGLTDVVVVDTDPSDESALIRDLGAAAAHTLEVSIRPGDVIGISSWSSSLLAMVNALHPVAAGTDVRVVQLLGGVGNPAAEVHATDLTRRLARLMRGTPVLLPVPGLVGSGAARRVLEQDEHVRAAFRWYPEVTIALVGIGAVDPSPLLASSGNVLGAVEQAGLSAAGAVGDICLRWFDADGAPVATAHDECVIGVTMDQLRRVPRRIAVAGGPRKVAAVAGALRTGLITHLVTDAATARAVLDAAGRPSSSDDRFNDVFNDPTHESDHDDT